MKQRMYKATLLKSLSGLCAVAAVMMTGIVPAHAGIIYSNDFETNTNGFSTTATGILATNNTGGHSTWLGGDRSLSSARTTLTLTGLTAGNVYDVMFDLWTGGTWDGSWSFGPDFFGLESSSSGLLVNATFGVGTSNKTQTYSDATPLGDGGLFPHRTGMDVLFGNGLQGEGIYYFGHGAGNPLLSFTAGSTIETLTFSSLDAQGISDEFYALDNVVVSSRAVTTPTPSVPEPAPLALLGLGLLGLTISRKRRA